MDYLHKRIQFVLMLLLMVFLVIIDLQYQLYTVVCKIIESPSSFDFYRFFFLTNVIFSFQFYRQSIDSDVLSQYLL